jgi:hypothetical protein
MVLDRGDRGLFTIWTRSFWIKIIFPFPLSPAKWISDFFDIKGCGVNNLARAHRSSLRQWRCGQNSQRKLWTRFELADFFLDRAASLFMLRTFSAQINWRVIRRKVLFDPHRFCQTNRLFNLLERAEKEIRFSMASGMFKTKMDINRYGPRLMLNNCKNLNPPYFSLPSTFKEVFVTVHHFCLGQVFIRVWWVVVLAASQRGEGGAIQLEDSHRELTPELCNAAAKFIQEDST